MEKGWKKKENQSLVNEEQGNEGMKLLFRS